MTPLAYAIAKQTWLPPKRRKPVFCMDTRKVVSQIEVVSDIHCFECTQIMDLAFDLSDSGKVPQAVEDGAFLPAPRTWIEHIFEGRRHGWLMSENPWVFSLIIERDDDFAMKDFNIFAKTDEAHTHTGMMLALLALINSPRIIGRQQFWPHRRLERELNKGAVGSFPLHAWTELTLRVAKPIDIDDGEAHEAHLTGRRAMHFCRAHLRIRLGQIEYVTSHWRGDAAIGIKQTRYTMKPQRAAG